MSDESFGFAIRVLLCTQCYTYASLVALVAVVANALETLHLLGLLILITGQMKEASLVNILSKVSRHLWHGYKLNILT